MSDEINERSDVHYVLVVAATDQDGGLAYVVGYGGVTSMRIVKRSGPYCYLPYIEVWTGDHLHAELPQHSTLSVEFAKAQPDLGIEK